MGVDRGKSEIGGWNGCKNLGDRQYGSIIPPTRKTETPSFYEMLFPTSKIELLVIKKNIYQKTKTNVLARIMNMENNTKHEFQSTAWKTLLIKQTARKSWPGPVQSRTLGNWKQFLDWIKFLDWLPRTSLYCFTIPVPQSLSWRPTAGQKGWELWVRDWKLLHWSCYNCIKQTNWQELST